MGGRNVRVAAAMVLLASSLALPALADSSTLHHQFIVDSFGEGWGGRSELYAVPDPVVQSMLVGGQENWLAARQLCETVTAGACAGTTGLAVRYYLPPCSATTTSYCIEGLDISSGAGTALVPGISTGSLDERSYPAVPARGLPAGGTPSFWQVPGAKNAGGTDTYAVKVIIDGFMSSKSTNLFVQDLSAMVEGYKVTELAPTDPGGPMCNSWQYRTSCGQHVDLAEGQRLALTLRMPNTIAGWINGRLHDSSITITKIDDTQNRLRVEADPVLVPEVNVWLTDAQFNALPDPSRFQSGGPEVWDSVNAGNEIAIEWVRQLAGPLKDTASGEHMAWSFSTAGGGRENDCFNDRTRLIGLVTTNSAAYAPGAPIFSGGTLNYRVGGLHFRPDGKTLTLGTYDLLIRSDTARCLYGFSNAPLQATVSVSYGNGGDQVVATSALSERDGWLHLAAMGFTFSAPTLKVTLSQAKPVASPPTAAKPRATTITCTKGKAAKKVTAVNAKCPPGWKRR